MLENIAHLALGFATVLLALQAGQKHEQMRKKQNKHEPSSLSLSFEDICPQWKSYLADFSQMSCQIAVTWNMNGIGMERNHIWP
jgi:hypothetical protein